MAAEEELSVQGMQGLLQQLLPAEDFNRWKPHDIENLLGKRFDSAQALTAASIPALQAPPGNPLPYLLIAALLKATNPAALGPPGGYLWHQ